MASAAVRKAVSGRSPDRLRITEIFYSIQGESLTVGRPTVFIRLTGCPLRCGYCDTAYAFHGGRHMSLDEIMETTASYAPRNVTVTGGEPLAQHDACLELLRRLADAGYGVSLETSGALDIAEVDPRVSRVVDVKTPGSGEQERNRWENLERLRATDQLKFVLCDRTDYEWAREVIRRQPVACEVLFSPSHDQLPARDLAEWILADRLPVRLQLQMHKYIWGDVPGR